MSYKLIISKKLNIMSQYKFRKGDIVKEKNRSVQMKIIDILPAKISSFYIPDKYVCEWFEKGSMTARICSGDDLQYVNEAQRYMQITKKNMYV